MSDNLPSAVSGDREAAQRGAHTCCAQAVPVQAGMCFAALLSF